METMKTLSNNFFTNIINPQQHIVTNLSGRFLVTSNQGNKYLFVLYQYNSNKMMLRPKKNKTDKEFICFVQDLHGHLNTNVLKPSYMQLDNKASPAFQDLMKEKSIG